MTPAQIPLTLSADVLRLPYTLTTRVVLAEIVSLYAANAGCCDASNAHFMARLSIKHDAVNDAIKLLEKEGLVVKTVDKAAGFYRTLRPLPAAIAAKSATNPYPEKPIGYSEKPTGASRKNRQGLVGETDTPLSEKPTSPSRENREGLIGKTDTNTPSNIPSNLHTPTDAACAAGGESEKKLEVVGEPEKPNVQASHTKGAAADVATRKPAKPAKVAPEESPAFLAFWVAYPRHDDKLKAAHAFARLPADDQAQAAERATAWFARRTDWISPEGKDYRPYPATWLNAKRWLELAEKPTPPPAATTSHASSQGFSKPGAARHHVPKVDSYGTL